MIELTQDQQAVLDGAKGPLHAEYLQRLIEWGEAFGAERLIPVESAMINGINVPNESIGDVPTELVESYVGYVESCLSEQVAVPTISHGSTMDMQRAELHDSDLSQVPALEGMLEQLVKQGKLRRVRQMTLQDCRKEIASGRLSLYGDLCAFLEPAQSVIQYEISSER